MTAPQTDLETRLREGLAEMGRDAIESRTDKALRAPRPLRLRVVAPLAAAATVAAIAGFGAVLQSQDGDPAGPANQADAASTSSEESGRIFTSEEILTKQEALVTASIRGRVPPIAHAGANSDGTALDVAVPQKTYDEVGEDALVRAFEEFVGMPVTVRVGEAPTPLGSLIGPAS